MAKSCNRVDLSDFVKMDQKSNKKKAKDWLYRLLRIKTTFQSGQEIVDDVCLRKPTFENADSRLHRNSFRRSLRKMQNRVKSCMFPQRPVTISEAACTSRVLIAPPLPPPRVPAKIEQQEEETIRKVPEPLPPNHRIPTDEIVSLSTCYWYWGPMPTSEAEERLQFKPDGTFLVRDSSSASYLFSISFRSVGKTMHARIEYCRGRYNLCGTNTAGFPTVTELIQDAMKASENGIYCYSRRGDFSDFPVRLTKPISRYTEVRPLKYLCKFVVRQYTNMNDIPKLPLPTVLHSYLLEKPYF